MDLLDKIGVVLLHPKKGFEALAFENKDRESHLLQAIIALDAGVLSYYTSTPKNLINFFVTIIAFIMIWNLYILSFTLAVKKIYKVPGDYRRAIELSNYSLISFIIPSIAIPVAYYMGNLMYLIVVVISSAILWFIYLHALLYYLARAYFKVDLVQFLVAIFVSWIIVVAILSVFGVITAYLINTFGVIS